MTKDDPFVDTIMLKTGGEIELNPGLELPPDHNPNITMCTGNDRHGNSSTLVLAPTYIEIDGIRHTPENEQDMKLIYESIKAFTDYTVLTELVLAVRQLQRIASPAHHDELEAVMKSRGLEE